MASKNPLDAEELFETMKGKEESARLWQSCNSRRAMTVIDELLSQRSSITGDEADLLLDLRWTLGHGDDAEGTLRLFCELRLAMERRHYLALFRVRRWLERHVQASIYNASTKQTQFVGIKLDYYCVEAIRRASLCVAITNEAGITSSKLEFVFRAQHDAIGKVDIPNGGGELKFAGIPMTCELPFRQ